MPISNRSLLPLALAAILTPAAVAQGTLTPVLTRAFPTPGYTDLAFGEVYGNEEPVLAALDDGTVKLYLDPTAFDARSAVTSVSGVTSVTVQRSSVPGAVEDLLLTAASGLVRVRGTLDWGLEAPVVLLGGAWQNAVEIEALDLDGVPFVLGLNAARDQLMSAIDLGGGVWADAFTLSAPPGETILGFAAFDYDADGVTELAFLTEEDLWVVEQDGTPLLILRSWGGSEGSIAALTDGGGQRLAWATRNPAGTPVLKVFSSAGPEAPVTLVVPVVENDPAQAISVVRMVSGDLDADGNDDLLLTDAASHRMLALYNQGAPAHFSLASLGNDHRLLHTDASDPYASGAENGAAPVLGSTLGHDVIGVFSGLNTIGSIVVNPGTGVGGTCNDEPTAHASCFISPDCTHALSGSNTILNLAMVLPSEFTTAFTHVQLSLWRQPTEGGSMDSGALSHQLFPFYFDSSSGTYTAQQWFQVSIPEDPANQGWGSRQYYLRYRFVTANTAVTPPTIGDNSAGFRTGVDAGDTAYLSGEQTTGSSQVDFGFVASTPFSAYPGATHGNFIYTDVQPPPATEPNVGSLVLVPGNGNAPW